jgi:hypothetical protein
METWRFIGQAFSEGMKQWKDSVTWALASTIPGLLGASLIASRFWSLHYVWQGISLMLLAGLITVASGARSLNSSLAEDSTRLAAENQVLTAAAAAQPPRTTFGHVDISSNTFHDIAGDAIHFATGSRTDDSE